MKTTKLLKTLFVATGAAVMSQGAFATLAWAGVKISADKKTLTFEGRSVTPISEEGIYQLNGRDKSGKPLWCEHASTVTKVVFAETFTSTPTDCSKWFYNFTKLETIEGIGNLKVNSVKDMQSMFDGCSALKTLDLSSFKLTGKVTNMSYMFFGCTALEKLDISNLKTKKVTSMGHMFEDCTSLSELDVSSFDTSLVEDMEGMFCNCSALKKLDLSNFNTANVTIMRDLASYCYSLKMVSVAGFDVAKVTDMEDMFKNCNELVRIVGPMNNLDQVDDSAKDNMFLGCDSLTGSFGTSYASTGKDDGEYARIDKKGTPGYFSVEAVAVFDGTDTLTFYCDGEDHSNGGALQVYRVADAEVISPNAENPAWYAHHDEVTTVVLDSSFYQYRPVQLARWFYSFELLTTIEGMENLNTYMVTNFKFMFAYCMKLQELDLWSFSTYSATDMGYMFWHCEALAKLDVSGFDTCNVTDMSWMFSGCSSLAKLDVSNFDTWNVTDMSGMFANCSSLVKLDVSGFDTWNVTDMSWMFSGCSSLAKLDVSRFNTYQVANMESMFEGCSKLENFNLHDFDMGAVSGTRNMFKDCSSLTKIAVSDTFDVSYVSDDADMFAGCTALKGGNGTAFDASHVDNAYAIIDGTGGNKGYLSAAPEAKAVWDSTKLTLKFVYDDNNYGTKDTDWFSVYESELYPEWDPTWWGCNAAETVEFDASFRNYQPRHCRNWFHGFSALNKIECMGNLDTSKATDFYSMFNGCESLVEIDLSEFEFQWYSGMGRMFLNCSSLERIYARPDFDLSKYSGCDDDVFTGCVNLVGGEGTTYDSTMTDSSYGRIDNPAKGKPGYFSSGAFAKAVVEDGGKTLRFVYDRKDYGTEDTDWFYVADDSGTSWYTMYDSVTKVIFDTSFSKYRPTDCSYWFDDFGRLATIEGLENFDTSEVTTMCDMFCNCVSLTSLDLSSFDTSNVEDMSYMFDGCARLGVIYVSNRFRTENATTTDGDMFGYCYSLIGGNGTAFDAAKIDVDYARIDKAGEPGYFTDASVPRVKVSFNANGGSAVAAQSVRTGGMAVMPRNPRKSGFAFAGWFTDSGLTSAFDFNSAINANLTLHAKWTALSMRAKAVLRDGGKTLCFVCDDVNYGTKDVDWFSVAESELARSWPDKPTWAGLSDNVTKVVFDASFSAYCPTNCYRWFCNFEYLAAVEGMGNLNVSKVTNMYSMFDYCHVLASLDVSGWDTSNVTSMRYLFYGCESLTSLDVSNFDTSKVTDMQEVFSYCLKLTMLDLSNWDTSKVTDMDYMFSYCPCLETIYASGSFVTDMVKETDEMFVGCVALVGGNGTAYDNTKDNAEYARIDMPGSKGYFTSVNSVTFDANGGTASFAKVARISGHAIGTLPTAARKGYSFSGWFTAGEGGTKVTESTIVTKDVTFYAQWVRKYPKLFDSVTGGSLNVKGTTYNGFLGEDTLGGTFSIVVKKPKKGATEADATMTLIDPVSGKKVKVSGKVDVNTGICSGNLAGLTLGAKGIVGTYNGKLAQGTVDASKEKDKDALAVMNAFNKKVFALVIADEDGNIGMLSGTFSSKGKVKIAGTVAGNKVSGSTQMSIGDRCAVPFVYSKKNAVTTFVLWFDKTTKELIDVSGLGDGVSVIAKGESGVLASGKYAFKMTEAAVRASVADAIDQTPTTVNVTWNGKKFDAGKAAKVSYKNGDVNINGSNVLGLSLKYAKGALSGSFTIYSLSGSSLKKNKFTVSGVVIDGVGYGLATNKKLGTIEVGMSKK